MRRKGTPRIMSAWVSENPGIVLGVWIKPMQSSDVAPLEGYAERSSGWRGMAVRSSSWIVILMGVVHDR